MEPNLRSTPKPLGHMKDATPVKPRFVAASRHPSTKRSASATLPPYRPNGPAARGGRMTRSDALSATLVAVAASVNLWKVESVRDATVIDPTLLTMAALLMASLLSAARHLRIGHTAAFLPLFLLVLLPGIATASFSTGYSNQKVLLLLTLVPLLILAPQQLIVSAHRMHAFSVATGIIGFTVACAIELRGSADIDAAGRVGLEDANVIGLGRVCALGAVCLLMTPVPARCRIVSIAGAAVCLHAAVLTGSRGPMLAAIVAVFLGSVASQRHGVGRLTRAAAILLLGGASLMTLSPSARILSAVGGRTDVARIELVQASGDLFVKRPWGIGWGDFALEMPLGIRDDSQGWAQYPHNVLLEAAVEGGILAALGLAYLVFYAWRRSLQVAKDDNPTPFALLTASIIFSLTSSDLTGNRTLWVMIGICLVSLPAASRDASGEPPTRGSASAIARLTQTAPRQQPRRGVTDRNGTSQP